jgi:hypothetical protein
MTLKANLSGSGIAPATAQNIVGTVLNTQTATGSSSQANSFAISSDITVFTVAASNSGARLPSTATAGDNFIIANYDSNTMLIYPPVGGILNGGSLNASVSLATKKSAECICIDNLNFIVMLGG